MRRLLLSLLLVLALPAPAAADQPACRDHLCPPGPVAMGRLVTSGFEVGWPSSTTDQQPDGGLVGGSLGVSRSTTTFRSGAASLQSDGSTSQSSARYFSFPDGALGRTSFMRAYLFIPSATSLSFATATQIIQIDNGNTLDLVDVRLTPSGTLQLFAGATGRAQVGSDTAALARDTWVRIEVAWTVATTSTGYAELLVDGVSVAAASNLNLGSLAPTSQSFSIGYRSSLSAAPNTIYFDDVALNDNQGASQNSWPGGGSVVLLVPTADSAKGTGWTNDAAGTTNLFQAVDNQPPAGIADTTTGSGLHQLRNATSNANSNYDATMTTYTAAGVTAGATINVIDPIIETAAPVTTSAKQGTVGVVSNPAIANVALGAGGTTGAFWSGTAAGTYSTGWKLSHGTATYAPTVVLGTAPVMRVTQVTSSTRIAMVSFMGIYVDWTPAPVAPADPIRQDNSSTLFPSILQAVNRGASF